MNIKRLIPYPMLLTLAILIDRVVISALEIDPWQSIRPLVIVLVLVMLITLVIQRSVQDGHRANFLTLIILGSFLLYRAMYGFLKGYTPLLADYLALALIPILAFVFLLISRRRLWEKIGDPARLSTYFSAVFALLLLFQLVRLGGNVRALGASQGSSRAYAITPLSEEIQLRAESRPDIYVIVLDGYGRQDVLEQIYDHDNSEFLESLEERGFYIARESHSNYIQTVYSIVSLLNFDYVQPWEEQTSLLPYLLTPVRNNRVFQMLDEIGYTTVSFESGTTYTQIDSTDAVLSNFLPLNRFESLLLVDSPIEPLSNIFNLRFAIPGYPTHRARTLYDFDELGNLTSITGPKIVYAHIIIPHPPFVFDENGNAIDPARPYSIWDGDEYQGTLQEYRQGYRKQVIFANRKIIETIDNILANSDTKPIIVLMGDHGPGSMFHWDIESPGCLWERTSNLYAILLPGNQTSSSLYPSLTPVNTFRLIFNMYFDTNLPMLEDDTYFVSSQTGSLVRDITQSREVKTGCEIPK